MGSSGFAFIFSASRSIIATTCGSVASPEPCGDASDIAGAAGAFTAAGLPSSTYSTPARTGTTATRTSAAIQRDRSDDVDAGAGSSGEFAAEDARPARLAPRRDRPRSACPPRNRHPAAACGRERWRWPRLRPRAPRSCAGGASAATRGQRERPPPGQTRTTRRAAWCSWEDFGRGRNGLGARCGKAGIIASGLLAGHCTASIPGAVNGAGQSSMMVGPASQAARSS